MKLSSVIVAYNPTEILLENIKTFLEDVDLLFLVNNSGLYEVDLSFINESMKGNFHVIDLNENLGISEAINIAARKSIELGADYLLTMDQDSKFSNFSDFKKLVSNDLSPDIAIYSPAHITGNRVYPSELYTYVESVMTSGNILNLDIFFELGCLDEGLFIDRVDHDYCASVRESGYLIKRYNNIPLQHGLGNTTIRSGKEITNHSPLRRYYITRNTLYIASKHFKKSKLKSIGFIKSLLVESMNVLIYENDKKLKLRCIFLGIRHFIKGVKGGVNIPFV